ncbi:hypothetical protein [Lysobacter sp. A3-1-A15]|uniref:hypothetical protein n=1 Tax=Novilysobacter viscosus TaxID=3098602 RepID=UPI002ED7DEF8
MKLSMHALAASLLLAVAAPVIAQGPPPHLPAEVLAETADPDRVAYLARNVVADGPIAGGFEFRFEDAFYDSPLFLLGESHGAAAPQVFDLALLTHLNARIGLVDYLAEVDPVQALWLNRYLLEGDEALLDRVFDLWNGGSQWASTDYEDKVRAIRALNLTLADDRRIRIHGIDAIQDWPLLAQWLHAGGATLDMDAYEAAGIAARARLAADALAAMPGADEHAGLLAALERQAAGTDRETVIFENYADLVRGTALGARPAYGLWGIAHVFQGPVNGQARFAGMVRASDLPGAASVRSIALYGLDSAYQFPVPMPTGVARVRFTDGNVDGPVVKLAGSATLRAASTAGHLTVFRVGADGSPFRHGQDFVALRSSMDPGIVPDAAVATTDYLQYVGVYQGSDWAAPREGSGQVIAP